MRKTSVLTACFLACFASADIASAAAPTFFARRDYPDLGFNWVAVADTNGDGIPDAIGMVSGKVQVLFGNGNGTFRHGPETQTGMQREFTFAPSDSNGDHRVDLVLAGSQLDGPSGIGISRGNGDGTFQAHGEAGAPGRAQRARAGGGGGPERGRNSGHFWARETACSLRRFT